MSKSNLLKLLIVTTISCLVLLVVKLAERDNSSEYTIEERPLLELAGKDIATIRLVDDENEIVLQRNKGEWFLKLSNSLPVAKGRVALLFQKLGMVSAGKRIEATPKYYKRLKLDEPNKKNDSNSGTLVEFFKSSGEPYCSLVIGKTIHNPKSADGKYSAWYPDRRYMRIKDKEDFVWLVNDPLHELTTFMGDWIDSHVIEIKQPQEISVVKSNQKASLWCMKKERGIWNWMPQSFNIDVPKELGSIADSLFSEFSVLDVTQENVDFSESFIIKVKDLKGTIWQLTVGSPKEDHSHEYMERISGGMFQRQGINLRYPIKVEILNSAEKALNTKANIFSSWYFWVKSEELPYFLVTKTELGNILDNIKRDILNK